MTARNRPCPSAQCMASVGTERAAMTTRLVAADGAHAEAEHDEVQGHEQEAAAVGEHPGEYPDGGCRRHHGCRGAASLGPATLVVGDGAENPDPDHADHHARGDEERAPADQSRQQGTGQRAGGAADQ